MGWGKPPLLVVAVSGVTTPMAMAGALTPGAVRCATCRHFADGARQLEARLPGLNTLSSAYAAVRAGDGLCEVHDRYVAASSRCASWAAALGGALPPGTAGP